MKLFSTWTRDQIVAAIQSLEQQLATGATQLSMAQGGSVTVAARTDALKTLAALYRRLNEIDGTNYGNARVVRVIVKRGY